MLSYQVRVSKQWLTGIDGATTVPRAPRFTDVKRMVAAQTLRSSIARADVSVDARGLAALSQAHDMRSIREARAAASQEEE